MGGTKYTITPTIDRTNPPLLTYDWNWQQDAEIINNGTTGLNNTPIDKDDLQVCLGNMRNGGWHRSVDPPQNRVVCGGLKWLPDGKKSWKDPNGCHMACINALSRALNAGTNFAKSDTVHKCAHCWEMFSNADGINGN